MTTTTNALDALLAIRDGYTQARWNFPLADGTPVASPGGIGQGVTLTYSFAATTPNSYYAGPTATRFTPEMIESTRAVLDHISEIANVTFSEVGGASQITFRQGANGGASGDAYLPFFEWQDNKGTIDYQFEPEVSGDVWMDDAQTWSAADLEPGGFAYLALLRNVGTALGLKDHSEDWATMLAPELNDQAHTVMSPIAAPNDRPSTMMLLDIQALQYLYGANMQTRAGDDVYDWGTSAPLLEAIWDGGGIDTIDLGNQVQRCVVRLKAGSYSQVGRDGEFAIAKGVVIENAIGGRARDVLVGNAADNELTGNAGADKLTGGAGADVFDFNVAAHSGPTDAVRDLITDFTRGTDRIDLSGIDARASTSANEAFRFIGGRAFDATDATGQLRFEGGVVYGSTDADAAAEFSIALTGVASLNAADFVL